MSHLPQRWVGIVLRAVRRHYPSGRIAAWGSVVDRGVADARTAGDRLELVFLEPRDPDPAVVQEIRRALECSDLPVDTDLRVLNDLTMAEQEDVLQRGEQFGG